MTYKDYNELTVMKTSNCVEKLSFDTLAKIIITKPSNVIYCIHDGKLYGIISMGDIARARDMGLDAVPVNRCFTHIFPNEYMKARRIFREKENVNAIPVMRGGVVLGDYTRWDDLLFIKYLLELKWDRKAMQGHESNSIVLVRSRWINKQKNFRIACEYLSSQDITVKCIDHMEVVDHIFGEEPILFVDEDERRAIDTFLAFVLNIDFDRKILSTFQRFVFEIEYKILDKYLDELYSKGVHIVNLFYSENEFSHLMNKRICDKFADMGEKVSNVMPSGMYQEFFDELYTEEYVKEIMDIRYLVETESGTGKLKDCNSKYYNVTNGERYTVGQPSHFTKSIYFLGPCFIFGFYVEDSKTIESFLQSRFNQSKYNVRVVNCGSPSYNRCVNLELARIIDIPLNRGDIIVLYEKNRIIRGRGENLDLINGLKKHNVNVSWMVDAPQHCNHKINSIYADAIFDALEPFMKEPVDEKEDLIEKDHDFVKLIYIDRYFADFNAFLYNKIGAIVVNCNPFTYGHRYLIEQALEKVDFLIIFVVEEDKSVFSFSERFAMVCGGIADLEKVKIVPSGPFILSQTTFPEYFIKETDEEIVENVENDITLFAETIAPCLNIRYRFVGEELGDEVTNEYNKAMKRILPKKGIELIEIPRKGLENECISASLVRECLENNDMKKLENLVPESTRKVLFNNDNK